MLANNAVRADFAASTKLSFRMNNCGGMNHGIDKVGDKVFYLSTIMKVTSASLTGSEPT